MAMTDGVFNNLIKLTHNPGRPNIRMNIIERCQIRRGR